MSSSSSSVASSNPRPNPPRRSDDIGPPTVPPLGPDGKPVGPPLSPDGKPMLPPPLIGPDGQEIPRPLDGNGRPLPVYVTKDRKPVLDEDGKAIPIRFDENGKPVPLPGMSENSGSNPNVANNGLYITPESRDAIPKCFRWIGLVDFLVSLIFAILIGYEISIMEKNENQKVLGVALTSAIVAGVGCCCGALLIVAVSKSSRSPYNAWCAMGFLLFVIQVVALGFATEGLAHAVYVAAVWTLLRLFLICGSYFRENTNSNGVPREYYVQRGGGAYPRDNTANRTILIQQPPITSQTYVQPVVMPAYGGYPGYGGYGYGGYGYGSPYGGYYGYGGGGVADAALLGLAAGSMMGGFGHHHHYYPDYDYGWGGGWDGGWGGDVFF